MEWNGTKDHYLAVNWEQKGTKKHGSHFEIDHFHKNKNNYFPKNVLAYFEIVDASLQSGAERGMGKE